MGKSKGLYQMFVSPHGRNIVRKVVKRPMGDMHFDTDFPTIEEAQRYFNQKRELI